MLESDLQELLREFLATSSARSVRIGRDLGELAGSQPGTKLGPQLGHQPGGLLSVPLGQGGVLSANFAESSDHAGNTMNRQRLEKCARSLRACLRRHEGLHWPEIVLPSATPARRQLILARMQQFLCGLVDSSPMRQMVLMCRGAIIASALPLEPLDHERLSLLARQLERIAANTQGSDHGELISGDVYARSFWYGAALFGFVDTDYSVDFIRHRCRHVAKELAHLLSMLDDDSHDPIR